MNFCIKGFKKYNRLRNIVDIDSVKINHSDFWRER